MAAASQPFSIVASCIEGGRAFVFLAGEGMEGVAVSPAWTSPTLVPPVSDWAWQFHCGPDVKDRLPEFTRLAFPAVEEMAEALRQRLIRRLEQGGGQVVPGAGDLATPYLFSPGEGTRYGVVLPREDVETTVRVGCRHDFAWKFLHWSATAEESTAPERGGLSPDRRARLITQWLFTCIARLLLGVGPVREERREAEGESNGQPTPSNRDHPQPGSSAITPTSMLATIDHPTTPCGLRRASRPSTITGTLHGQDPSRHLLLLEVINTDRFRVRRNEYHPFVQALVHQSGWTVSRAWVGVEAIAASSGQNVYVYDFPEEDRARVVAHLRALNPSHVLLNERLVDPLFAELQQAVPGASFRMNQVASSAAVSKLLEEWLEVRMDGTAGLLEEQVRPHHQGLALNALATRIRPFLPLLVGPECSYHRSLTGNPWFQGVDCSDLGFSGGCSFCLHQDRTDRLPAIPAQALALRQVDDALDTLETSVFDRDFLVRGVNLLPKLDELAEGLSAAGIEGCRFFVTSRLDSLMAEESVLRRALDRLAASKNSLHLWSIGVENLSEAENQRFNKGLPPPTVERGVVLVHQLAAEYPGTFGFSGFGFILFTPWTTLDDLRRNAEGFRRLGFSDMGRYLWTALQLLPGQPITRLARAHGLVVEHMEDCPADSGCITSWDDQEIPWRFQDQRAGRVYFVCRRLVPGGAIPGDDAAKQSISAWRNELAPHLRDLQGLFEALIEAAANLPEDAPLDELLQETKRGILRQIPS